MRKFLIFLLCAAMIFCASCSDTEKKPETQTTNKKCENHQFSEKTEIVATTFEDGVKSFTCKKCGERKTEAIPATNSLKILCIGNSYSIDSMEYLYDIAKDGGVKTVTLGNLYVSGCNLPQHYQNLVGSRGVYEYYFNTSGSWSKTPDVSIQTAMEQEWDIIVIQVADAIDSYDNLADFIKRLESLKVNKDARIFWNLNWAYQQNSDHGNFMHYDNDQQKMYTTIVSRMISYIKPYGKISGSIPSGTTIQNMRTTYLGDTLTRDGYHLSLDYGRYSVGLTWFSFLTGKSPDAINWTPQQYPEIKKDLDMIKQCVKDALQSPNNVTEQK